MGRLLAVALMLGLSAAVAPKAEATPVRVIRVRADFCTTSPAWWALPAAIRDWNRAPGIRVVLVRQAGPGVVTIRDYEEMGDGYFERAIAFSFEDGDEVWMNYTHASMRERAYRRSASCNAIGLLIHGPTVNRIGPSTGPTEVGNCMDSEADYAYPLTDAMLHPGRWLLATAR